MASEIVVNEGLAAADRDADYEADLVRRAKSRSPQAWAEIYDTTYPKLFRYVRARVGELELAEDLTATAYLEALKSIDSYVDRGRPLLAWLYAITRNVVNYHHRSEYTKRAGRPAVRLLSQLVRSGSGKADGEPPRGDEVAPDPGAAVERLDLRRAVARLSVDQREVIVLRYFVGLTTPEVAALLGKHERAVYSLQARAVKALRRHLG